MAYRIVTLFLPESLFSNNCKNETRWRLQLTLNHRMIPTLQLTLNHRMIPTWKTLWPRRLDLFYKQRPERSRWMQTPCPQACCVKSLPSRRCNTKLSNFSSVPVHCSCNSSPKAVNGQRYPCPAWEVCDLSWRGAGQRPRRGRSPVEHRRDLSVRPSVLPNGPNPSNMAQF